MGGLADEDKTTAGTGDGAPAADPGATRYFDVSADLEGDVAAWGAESSPADPNATQLIDDGVTRRVDSAATRIAGAVPNVGGFDPDATVAEPDLDRTVLSDSYDGINAMDDPYYADISFMGDLTGAQAPVTIESPVRSYPERKKRMPGWARAIVIVLLLAAVGGVAYYTYDQEYWGGKTVPTVVGLTEAQATEALEAQGFTVSVEYEQSDEYIGVVLSCSLTEGERASVDETAVLVVAAERMIPEVVGLTEDEARQALLDMGATNITVEYVDSDSVEGTVISVTPEEGSAFTSVDAITLCVAQPYTVPSVLGLTAEEAQEAIDAAGLVASFTYVESNEEANTVVAMSPDAGTAVAGGTTVELSVSTPYPSSSYHLLEYLDATSPEISTYLGSEGFSLKLGETYSNGRAHAVYTNGSGDVLQFSDYPERGGYTVTGSTINVLGNGADYDGIRLEFSSSSAPTTSVSSDGISAVMSTCGFSNCTEMCTQDDLAAAGYVSESEDLAFVCGYGTSGSYSWAVIISSEGGEVSVVALITPTSRFTSVDMSSYGGSPSYYLALVNLY